MKGAKEASGTWPLGTIAAMFFPYAVFCFLFASTQWNTRSAFTQPLTAGVWGLFLLRVIIARVRKEQSNDWIVYLVLAVIVPLLGMLYAANYIPYYSRFGMG